MLVIEKKSLKVGKFVNTEHVDTVIRSYKQEKWVHNSERLGKEDSLSVWHSIEELEELIAKANSMEVMASVFILRLIRKTILSNLCMLAVQTVVMVATKQKETENGAANKDIYINTEKGTEILAFNTGSICPPFCRPKGLDGDDGLGIAIIDKGQEGLFVI
ncbi:MAG: hypothetical protein WDO19_11060 [Bacteroidota bacterium]